MRCLIAVSTSIFGGGSGKVPTPHTHAPEEMSGLTCGGEGIYKEIGSEGSSRQRRFGLASSPVFGYRAQRKRWDLFPLGMRAVRQSWASGKYWAGLQSLCWYFPGCSDISDPVILIIIRGPQLIVCTSDPLAAFTSHTCFIWPTRGFFNYLIVVI